MLEETGDVGRRIREIRTWRGLNLQAAAGLAGISTAYLSRIERGLRPVNSRRVLEAVAHALRVAPIELTGQPWEDSGAAGERAHAGLAPLEAALEIELGEEPDVPARKWPEIAADVDRLQHLQHGLSDYAGQLELVPGLLAELHAAYVRQPQQRESVLLGMLHCYSSAMWSSKRLGGRGLPNLASRHAERIAAELNRPEWIGYAAWLRGDATGQLDRTRQYQRSVRVAEQLVPTLDHRDDHQQAARQAFGMLHLSAALASAAGGDRDTARTHLGEADTAAAALHTEVGNWAHLWFGSVNVGIWRTSLAAEAGDGATVAKLADQVPVEVIPSPSRRAEFRLDVGRTLLDSPRTRDSGLRLLLMAEREAPQRVRNDVFVREAVGNALRAERRQAGSRDLRYLAHLVGIAPGGNPNR